MNDELLTQDEHDALRISGELANLLRKVIGNGPLAEADWAEAAGHLHVLQRMIAAQAAARAYPNDFRLLGWPLPLEVNRR